MEKESKQKKYTCFTCLKESTDSRVCTHCGARIESIDLDNAIFSAPISGAISCKFESGLELQNIKSTIKDLEEKYHDTFDLFLEGDEVTVKCNDVAGERLINALKKAIKGRVVFLKD